MVRKFFVRLFLCFVALIGIVVLSACIAGYLALQQPAFYADLCAQQFSEGDQFAAKVFFQHMEKDLRLWRDRSLARQGERSSDSTTPATAIRDAFLGEYDPTKDTHSISIRERQINALLASGKAGVSGEWRNPRIRIRQDGVDFAFELVVSKARFVLSVELKPALSSESCLRLDLMAVRIGDLPLPLSTILRWLPGDAHYSGSDIEVDLTAPTPHICLNFSDKNPESPSVKSFKCMEREVTIEFLAPQLNCQQNERATAPLDLSRR